MISSDVTAVNHQLTSSRALEDRNRSAAGTHAMSDSSTPVFLGPAPARHSACLCSSIRLTIARGGAELLSRYRHVYRRASRDVPRNVPGSTDDSAAEAAATAAPVAATWRRLSPIHRSRSASKGSAKRAVRLALNAAIRVQLIAWCAACNTGGFETAAPAAAVPFCGLPSTIWNRAATASAPAARARPTRPVAMVRQILC